MLCAWHAACACCTVGLYVYVTAEWTAFPGAIRRRALSGREPTQPDLSGRMRDPGARRVCAANLGRKHACRVRITRVAGHRRLKGDPSRERADSNATHHDRDDICRKEKRLTPPPPVFWAMGKTRSNQDYAVSADVYCIYSIYNFTKQAAFMLKL